MGRLRTWWNKARAALPTSIPTRATHAPNRRSPAPQTTRTGAKQQWRTAPDFRGNPELAYAPRDDDQPDPGEVIWAWVPYEEDHRQGKDRPALVIGFDEFESQSWVLALPLTSKDHDRDAAQEASEGRYWLDIGIGSWDSRGRPSEVRLNRIVRLDPDSVRRIGGQVDEPTFERIATGVRRHLRHP